MIDVTFNFTTDSSGYWEGFWDRRDGLGFGGSDPDTEEVNNLHYTYDISRMDEKREAVKKAHAKRAYE